MPLLIELRVAHAQGLVALVVTAIDVERSNGLARQVTHGVAGAGTWFIDCGLETGLRVANVCPTHRDSAELLAIDLHAQLAWLARCEPVVHGVGVVVVSGIKRSHSTSLALESFLLVELEQAETKFTDI